MSHKQWWRVQFHDMDVEDWAVGDMMYDEVGALFCLRRGA
jgi:hypothetical protein